MIATVVFLWPANEEAARTFTGVDADPGPIHVHGLGVNPADRALYIATHTGLYRVAPNERKAERVAQRFQDTMGFSVVGPNRFLGSGHPDFEEAREKKLPPLLGLIESDDAGESWESISLLGEADFHVLRFLGRRVYGYDASNDRLLMSVDRGRTWRELDKPGPVVDLAADPANPRRLVVASASNLGEGLYMSVDEGRTWERMDAPAGLLAWPAPDALQLLTGGGLVFVSRNDGASFDHVGEVDGQPAAFVAESPTELYVALHDGTIKQSRDAGRTWTVRSTP